MDRIWAMMSSIYGVALELEVSKVPRVQKAYTLLAGDLSTQIAICNGGIH